MQLCGTLTAGFIVEDGNLPIMCSGKVIFTSVVGSLLVVVVATVVGVVLVSESFLIEVFVVEAIIGVVIISESVFAGIVVVVAFVGVVIISESFVVEVFFIGAIVEVVIISESVVVELVVVVAIVEVLLISESVGFFVDAAIVGVVNISESFVVEIFVVGGVIISKPVVVGVLEAIRVVENSSCVVSFVVASGLMLNNSVELFEGDVELFKTFSVVKDCVEVVLVIGVVVLSTVVLSVVGKLVVLKVVDETVVLFKVVLEGNVVVDGISSAFSVVYTSRISVGSFEYGVDDIVVDSSKGEVGSISVWFSVAVDIIVDSSEFVFSVVNSSGDEVDNIVVDSFDVRTVEVCS